MHGGYMATGHGQFLISYQFHYCRCSSLWYSGFFFGGGGEGGVFFVMRAFGWSWDACGGDAGNLKGEDACCGDAGNCLG